MDLDLEILDQPRTGNLGDSLKSILTSNQSHRFDTFSLLVAYVKKSGVDHLASSIQQFKRTGGHIKAVVGVSRRQKNTSVQGLQYLLPLCDEVWVYNNERPTSTFHPKVYFFEKKDEKAIVFVGSSNLTAGGLYTNYEVNSRSEYDLRDSSQVSKFLAVKQMFQNYSTPSKLCKRLTPELLQELYTKGYLSNEETEPEAESQIEETGKGIEKRIFGSEEINPPSVTEPAGETQIPLVDLGQVQDQWAIKGKLIWKKQLTRRDLQIVKSRTAPTGGISLTKADFRVKGKVINQTTYFSQDIFGGFNWKHDRPSSEAVATKVLFNVRINGKYVGQYRLTLRHNPKWESGQHNYTTSISWGPLTKLIRNPDLVGKTFSLYAPPKGNKEPFYVEIS